MIAGVLPNVPFLNVKLEGMFLQMAHLKTDWWNRVNWRNLDALLWIIEEGPQIDKFNANESIDH